MRVAFLGLGLIGGSIARAIRDGPGERWSIAAWSPRASGPRLAHEAGVIDMAAGSVKAAIVGADLIVLAAPPSECLDLLRELGGPLRRSIGPDAVITDVASTKASIVALAGALGLRFVGGHPMAGRESSGYGAADGRLFDGRPWVIVPPAPADAAAMARVEALATACRARPVRMGAAEHDAAVAGISHLPLILAAALVEAVAGGTDGPRDDWPEAGRLAASGWESMTRLARGDVEMGTGIAATNAPAIASRVRDVRDVLDAWLAILEAPGGPDEAAIRRRLEAARARLGGED